MSQLYLERLSSELFSVGERMNGPTSVLWEESSESYGLGLVMTKARSCQFEALELYQLALVVVCMIGLFECDNHNVCPVHSHVFWRWQHVSLMNMWKHSNMWNISPGMSRYRSNALRGLSVYLAKDILHHCFFTNWISHLKVKFLPCLAMKMSNFPK